MENPVKHIKLGNDNGNKESYALKNAISKTGGTGNVATRADII